MKFLKTATLIASVFATPFLAIGAEIPIFSDDFDTPQLFAENWSVTGHAISRDNAAYIPDNGFLMLRKEVPDSFAVSVKLTILKGFSEKTGKYGMAGISFKNGGNFLIRSDGYLSGVHTVSVDGKKKIAGDSWRLPNFQLGKAYELMLKVERKESGDNFSIFLDGRKYGSYMIEKRAPGDNPSLYALGAETIFDDFKLYKIAEESSPNQIVNSSFEQAQEGRPPFFNFQTLSAPKFEKFDQFLNAVALDDKEKVSGRQSLRMTFDDASGKMGVFTNKNSVVVGQPYVFSVYMKADRDDFPVRLITWELYAKWKYQTVKLSKEWKRYEMKVAASTRPLVCCGVGELTSHGTIWIDDMQLEIGTNATPYAASALDADFLSSKKAALPAVAPVAVGKLPSPLPPDTELDAFLGKATKFGTFYLKDVPAANRTDAYAACDDGNLYLGLRAYVKDLDKVTKKSLERDSFEIFGQDNIEILLDPGKSGKDYYQLVVSAANANTDVGFNRSRSWNGNWTSSAKLNPATKSIDYLVKIPFSMTGAPEGGEWGVNLCRYDSASRESSCTMPSREINFHQAKSFPTMVLPEGALKKYALNPVSASASGSCVNLTFDNRTGKDVSGSLTLSDNSGKTLARQEVELAQGRSELSVKMQQEAPSAAFLSIGSGKEELVNARSLSLSRKDPLKIIVQRSCFTEQDKTANFRVLSNLENSTDMTAVLRCEGVKAEAKGSSEFEIALPLASLAEGTHEALLEMQREGKTVASGKVSFEKRKGKEGMARVNHFLQCLEWNGKPILPLMPLLFASADNKAVVDFLHDNGFRYCVLNANIRQNKNCVKDSLDFLKRASEKGIGVLVWFDLGWSDTTPDDEIKSIAGQFTQYGNVIALQVLDEPELSRSSEFTRNYMQRIKGLLPEQVVFMNNTVVGMPNNFGDGATDILMVDDYVTNFPGKTLRDTVPVADMLVKAGEGKRQPRFFFLVGNNAHNHYREPSEAEQIAQTWGVIAKGCTGAAYFLGVPYWPGNWKGYKQVNREVLELTEVLLDPESAVPASVSSKDLLSLTRRHEGFLYVVLVNIDKAPQTATVELPSCYRYDGAAECVFDGGTATLKDGRFNVELPGESRAIYKIKVK